MVEGLRNLIKVRRRQDIGVAEVNRLYPDLMQNEGKARLGAADLIGLVLRAPFGFAVYMSVHVAVRMGRKSTDWTRGR